ncbi:MAG: hypothetical protein IH626_17565 [Rhodospirillales bacterium]|nr:hypothetical protein [Rhodospirillales bacterium]
MATNTLDPRKSFTSTRFKTSRFPGFVSQTLDTTGNVEEEPAAVASPLRGVGLGLSTESDGPGTDPVGKQYTDMNRDEIDREYENRALNQAMFGIGMPTNAEELGKKAVGVLASATPVGAIGPLSRGLDYFTKEELDRAEQALSKQELKRAAGIAGTPNADRDFDPSDMTGLGVTDYDRAAIEGDPTARGYNTPQPDYSGSDEAGPSVGDPNAGTTTDTDDSGRGAQGPSEADSGGTSANSDNSHGGSSEGHGGDPSTYRMGGPIPNRGSPEIEPVRITAHETEHVMNPETVQFWGQDVLDAMGAVAEGVATPEQVQLLRQMINRGPAESILEDRPNPMQAMGSPLRAAGRGYLQ